MQLNASSFENENASTTSTITSVKQHEVLKQHDAFNLDDAIGRKKPKKEEEWKDKGEDLRNMRFTEIDEEVNTQRLILTCLALFWLFVSITELSLLCFQWESGGLQEVHQHQGNENTVAVETSGFYYKEGFCVHYFILAVCGFVVLGALSGRCFQNLLYPFGICMCLRLCIELFRLTTSTISVLVHDGVVNTGQTTTAKITYITTPAAVIARNFPATVLPNPSNRSSIYILEWVYDGILLSLNILTLFSVRAGIVGMRERKRFLRKSPLNVKRKDLRNFLLPPGSGKNATTSTSSTTSGRDKIDDGSSSCYSYESYEHEHDHKHSRSYEEQVTTIENLMENGDFSPTGSLFMTPYGTPTSKGNGNGNTANGTTNSGNSVFHPSFPAQSSHGFHQQHNRRPHRHRYAMTDTPTDDWLEGISEKEQDCISELKSLLLEDRDKWWKYLKKK